MVCPRCDRSRIERDGVIFRCAVCGMPYDATSGKSQSRENSDPSPHLQSLTSIVFDEQAVLHP
jgi:uncharacterized Zn finger protein (UPF0148 family)